MRFLMIIFLILLFNVNCNNENKKSSNKIVSNVSFDYKANLVQYSTCQEVEYQFKKELKRKYQRQYYYDIKMREYWLNNYNDSNVMPVSTESPTGAAEFAGTGDESQKDYSETNVQEQGVDEVDLVKTDGNYIYTINNSHFIIVDAGNPVQLRVISDIHLKNDEQYAWEYFNGIYLYQNLVLVLSDKYEYQSNYSQGNWITVVRIFDTSTKNNPVQKAVFFLPGISGSNSRLIGENLYIVHNKRSFDLHRPASAWDYISADYSQKSRLDRYFEYLSASDKAIKANLERIDNLNLQDFWPQYQKILYTEDNEKSFRGDALECKNLYIPQSGNDSDIGIITNISLNTDNFDTKTSGVMTSWGMIYMSLKNLYLVSMNRWLWFLPLLDGIEISNPEPLTGIHKFEISPTQDENITYKGSGLVNGWVNDQFSLSEYQEFLRVGTTRGGWWGENISNQLVILKSENNQLVETGKIEDLAKSERIYSMRYDRDRAYMVTFRRTDPLFTFDLSDPYNPKVLGELKISGFSTYIHLFGENNNKLLTIGRSADENGRVIGNKLQIFDVSDLANPSLVDSHELGIGWSEALYDHHAFLYYSPKNLLAIPFSSWTYDNGYYSYKSGLKVFFVNDTGLNLRGEITHPEVVDNYWFSSTVRRSLVIGNFIFSISNQHLLANNLNDLSIASQVNLP